ncbi:putative Poly [ADP-ribose] polymerase 2 [Hypsibius exemplaris]|uniref:Poly [ADP-ribose] polymerase n=1 Tax=Hypsibius exemplaris TaxID=2072580 RepID=A0A1W0XAR4_HYPEX|nr:putative Poly [ADP-ribose] polymerase 2 [Hypsibius exemplaris]
MPDWRPITKRRTQIGRRRSSARWSWWKPNWSCWTLRTALNVLGDKNIEVPYNAANLSKKLDLTITFVGPKASDFCLIKKYLKLMHGPTHWGFNRKLLKMFSLADAGGSAGTAKRTTLGNRMPLRHGRRTANVAGVLCSGLRIAPLEALVSGYNYGKAVYFADASSKSASYCHAEMTDGIRCEVAFGQPNELLECDFNAANLAVESPAPRRWSLADRKVQHQGTRYLPVESPASRYWVPADRKVQHQGTRHLPVESPALRRWVPAHRKVQHQGAGHLPVESPALRVQQAQWNLFLFILRLISLLPGSLRGAVATTDCPPQCRCVPGKGGQEVSCHGRNLTHLPQFPADMVSLDFSHNNLTRIPSNVFPALRHLKSLWLDDNKITHIDKFAFRGIHGWDMLSIRDNKALHHLGSHSLSGIRNVRNLILTGNNISWIEKGAFHSSKHITLLALYGNPLKRVDFKAFNELHDLHEIRLPLGIETIVPGAFFGLSNVHELVLEGLQTEEIRSETFYNLTNLEQLTIFHSQVRDISPRAFAGAKNISTLTFSYSNLTNIDADIFRGAGLFQRIVFEKCNLSHVQLDFPEAVRHAAERVIYDANEAHCCELRLNLKAWRQRDGHSQWTDDFLRGVWCITPIWVAGKSLHGVDLEELRRACNGELTTALAVELLRREKQKPPLIELYKMAFITPILKAGWNVNTPPGSTPHPGLHPIRVYLPSGTENDVKANIHAGGDPAGTNKPNRSCFAVFFPAGFQLP